MPDAADPALPVSSKSRASRIARDGARDTNDDALAAVDLTSALRADEVVMPKTYTPYKAPAVPSGHVHTAATAFTASTAGDAPSYAFRVFYFPKFNKSAVSRSDPDRSEKEVRREARAREKEEQSAQRAVDKKAKKTSREVARDERSAVKAADTKKPKSTREKSSRESARESTSRHSTTLADSEMVCS